MRTITWRTTTLAAAAFLLGTIAAGSGSLRAAWEPIARFVSLQDPPKPASANVLSEHEIAALDEMPPQSQAELLLERSINHYRGANDQIAARVDGWRGHITLDGRLNNLFMTAINSDDLTVRVAGIEVDIAAQEPRRRTPRRSIVSSRSRGPASRARAPTRCGTSALVGNRGVEPDRVAEILLGSIHDENVNIRYWAVEGLAYLGDRRHDRAAARRLPRRSVADDPRARRLRPGAVGHVQRGSSAARRCRACWTSPRTARSTPRRARGSFRRCAISPARPCRTTRRRWRQWYAAQR